MVEIQRGGNSRVLAKLLDGFDRPLAILDGRSQIAFVNSSFCEMVQLDPTVLVGTVARWDVTSDDSPAGTIACAIAPPATARGGKIAVRQLTAPLVFGSSFDAQCFVPFCDADGIPELTLVLLGYWHEMQDRFVDDSQHQVSQRAAVEQALVATRSRWQGLDGLEPLLGKSPSIQLAMQRAQLAATGESNFLIWGNDDSGTLEVAQAIFRMRTQRLDSPPLQSQFHCVACHQLEPARLVDALVRFESLVKADALPGANALVLEQVDRLDEAGVRVLLEWQAETSVNASLIGLSRQPTGKLIERDTQWAQLATTIATIELGIPPLAERREDLPILIQQVLAATCRTNDRAQLTISDDAMDLLAAYSWPGELRQLRGALESAVGQAFLTTVIQPEHLPVELRTFASGVLVETQTQMEPLSLDQLLEDVERDVLQKALEAMPRNRAQVARTLGISRPRLLRRISQLGLDADDSLAENSKDDFDSK